MTVNIHTMPFSGSLTISVALPGTWRNEVTLPPRVATALANITFKTLEPTDWAEVESLNKPEVMELLQHGLAYDAMPLVYANTVSEWFGFSTVGDAEGAAVASVGLVQSGGVQAGLGVEAGVVAAEAPSASKWNAQTDKQDAKIKALAAEIESLRRGSSSRAGKGGEECESRPPRAPRAQRAPRDADRQFVPQQRFATTADSRGTWLATVWNRIAEGR